MLYVSNVNCPGQYSLAGATSAIDAALDSAEALEAKIVKRLPVRGAWHCPLVRPAEQNLSFLDELTGLFNRRGFLGHARPQLDAAARLRRPMLLIFVDLDGLKPINDRLGHAAGDQALVDTAAVLKSTFRERDIIARLGGDEFVVLVTDASLVNPDGLLGRLDQRIQAMNERPSRPFVLAFSTGVARFDPGTPETLEELLSQADRRMYREKQRRKLGEAH